MIDTEETNEFFKKMDDMKMKIDSCQDLNKKINLQIEFSDLLLKFIGKYSDVKNDIPYEEFLLKNYSEF